VAVAWLALAGVSALAGVASFRHGYTVCLVLGTGRLVAWLTPGLADLVILGESAALLEVSRRKLDWPAWDIAALMVAIAATLAMNVAAAHPAWLPLWLVDAWPPVAFGLALHCLFGVARRGRAGISSPAGAATPGQLPPMTADALIEALLPHMSQRAISGEFGLSRARVARVASPPADAALAAEAPAGPPPAATPPGPPAMAAANGQVHRG
jgi:hypothetical protein